MTAMAISPPEKCDFEFEFELVSIGVMKNVWSDLPVDTRVGFIGDSLFRCVLLKFGKVYISVAIIIHLYNLLIRKKKSNHESKKYK